MTDARKLIRTNERGIYKRVRADGTVTGYAILFRQGGRQRKRYVPTLAAARAVSAKVHADIDRGEYQAPSTVRFGAHLTDWVESYRGTRGFRENTRNEYRRLLNAYALEYFPERLRLVDVRPKHIAEFVAWLADPAEQGKTLAPASIRNALIPVRAAMSEARRKDLIRTNPCDKVIIPRVDTIDEDDDENTKAMSRDELRLVLDLAGRHRLLVETLASTGLRVSELVGLQVKDLHLDGGAPHLTVRRAIVRGRVGPPKSRHGRRSVPLPLGLVRALREHVADLPTGPTPRCSRPGVASRWTRTTRAAGCSRRCSPRPTSAGQASTASGTHTHRCRSRAARTSSRSPGCSASLGGVHAVDLRSPAGGRSGARA
jgi:integrase